MSASAGVRALMAPKLVVLDYPVVILVVAGAFLLDTVVVFVAADRVLRRRIVEVTAS